MEVGGPPWSGGSSSNPHLTRSDHALKNLGVKDTHLPRNEMMKRGNPYGGLRMSRLEGWGFLCLMGCMLSVALSLSLLSGGWQVAGCGIGVLLGVLAGGLYGASVSPRTRVDG